MDRKTEDFSNKKNRELISSVDLFQAKQFIKYSLENSLHEKYEKEDEENKLLLEALNIAIIISYSRPFKNNRNSNENPADKTLSEEYLKCLTDDEKTLHKRIIDRRDQEIAHSDSNAHGVNTYGNLSIGRNTSIPLEKSEFSRLGEIIDKLLSRILLQ